MSKPVVGIIMGSDSDLDVMCEAAKILDEFGLGYEVRIISAHRTPVTAPGRGVLSGSRRTPPGSS